MQREVGALRGDVGREVGRDEAGGSGSVGSTYRASPSGRSGTNQNRGERSWPVSKVPKASTPPVPRVSR